MKTKDIPSLVNKLNQFNSSVMTLSQWKLFIPMLGLPKNNCFFNKFKNTFLVSMQSNIYFLTTVRQDELEEVLVKYRTESKENMRKVYRKRKARKAVEKIVAKQVFVINGVVYTDKPELDNN